GLRMSRRIYELLLATLPRGFRDEFGREMTQAFVDSRSSPLSHAFGILALAVGLRAEQLRMDVRYALRGLWHQKTFTLTAITTLALALGPATAVVSLINGVLLDPLPGARNISGVIYAYNDSAERTRHEFPWSELNFLDHRARIQ